MASLIPGYEYDIFISYRQKDNKGDRWVSKFVDALKNELEATFKEDVSVYFDENPHDRLQETHNVDRSLEGKLKCLIFIPILSQTYCDPNSYAWQYEFLAFLKISDNDRLGKDIKLRSGNVASRILPIRIHDLEQEDIKLFEKETGNVLRALDFVFKTSTGVSRPLKENEDHPNENLNRTFYSDQINKVGHAIKEIIQGVKADSGKEKIQHIKTMEEFKKDEREEVHDKPEKLSIRLILPGAIILMVLIVAGIFAYPKIFKQDTLEKLRSSGERISVAVMPFQNMIGDSSMNIYSGVIQTSIVNVLSNFPEELKTRQTEWVNNLIQSNGLNNNESITPSIARNISKKLDADVFIMGNIQKVGNIIRVYAQLINSNTDEVYKSFSVEAASKNELNYKIFDSLSLNIKDFLILSLLKQKISPEFRKFESTTSPAALIYYNSGYEAFQKAEYGVARESFSEAIKCDSTYILAYIWLAVTDLNLRLYDTGLKCCQLAYKKGEKMSRFLRLKLDDVYAWYTIGPQGRIKYLKQLIDLDDQNPSFHSSLANSYRLIEQYDKAIPEYERTMELNEKWDLKWSYLNYVSLGICYHKTGLFKKERTLYKKANRVYPDNSLINFRQFILALTEGDTTTKNEYYKKWRLPTWAKGELAYNLAGSYNEAGILDKAEVYFRQCQSFNSENYFFLKDFSYFLIDNNRNIDEGMELIDRALKLFPEDASINDIKGWGLYKQGKYKEALKFFEKSASLDPWYNHRLYLHIVATNKAIADQK